LHCYSFWAHLRLTPLFRCRHHGRDQRRKFRCGSGQVVYNPIDIHTRLVNFQQFFPLVTTGRHIASCTLTTTIKGQTLQYVLTSCIIVSLDAVVAGPRATGDTTEGYVDVKIAFDTLTFTSFGGADDSSSTPTS
jgi:hypothetical protein